MRNCDDNEIFSYWKIYVLRDIKHRQAYILVLLVKIDHVKRTVHFDSFMIRIRIHYHIFSSSSLPSALLRPLLLYSPVQSVICHLLPTLSQSLLHIVYAIFSFNTPRISSRAPVSVFNLLSIQLYFRVAILFMTSTFVLGLISAFLM